MTTLSKQELSRLTKTRGGRCVSIYMTTHRKGQEVLAKKDQIQFKNLLRNLEDTMQESGYGAKETLAFLDPAFQLLENDPFWRNRSEGLALFLTVDALETFTLPTPFTPMFYLSQEFFLLPLIPLVLSPMPFHLLSLNLHRVRLFRGDRYTMEETEREIDFPQRLEEVVGYDYREKFVGFRSQIGGGHPQATIYGHADWQADRKEEIRTFLGAIDKVVVPYLNHTHYLLILTGVEPLIAMYRELNSYGYLLPTAISSNPANLQPDHLHHQALDVIGQELEKKKSDKKEQFYQFQGQGRTGTDIKEVVPAAINGLIDTLFLADDLEVWGEYDKKNNTISVHEGAHHLNTSLINLAAVSVYENGGMVYIEKRDQIPFPDSGINALLRY